jgi:purine-binding chemotaxis protein CheW
MGELIKTDTALEHRAPIADQQQFLTFMLDEEMFAFGILHIKEILEFGQLTEVPRMPEFIRGVINLRGAVVPVIDLGARFGKHPTQVTRRTCIVIIELDGEDEKHSVGVMVSAVNDVVEIPPDQIEPAPEFGAQIRTDFIEGMGKIDERFVIILNVNHVLSLDEISSLAAVGKSLH